MTEINRRRSASIITIPTITFFTPSVLPHCMKSADGIELEDFLDLLKKQTANLDILRDEEPKLNRLITLLCMTAVFDCMDCEDPKAAYDSSVQVIENVASFSQEVSEMWRPKDDLHFEKDFEFKGKEWDSLLLKAQKLLDEIITEHLNAYGREKQEDIEYAFKESTLAITYMAAVACARSDDPSAALEYARQQLKATFDCVINECESISFQG